MIKLNKREFGQSVEQAVSLYLCDQKLKPVTSNFQCKVGEIDLIMEDCKQLVFIEVRYRRNHQYGRGSETVTHSKQQKIIKTALYFLQQNRKYHRYSCRFDVVDVTRKGETYSYNWVIDAFQATHFF